MTQQQIDFSRPATSAPPQTDHAKVRAFFEARPNQWVSLLDLEQTGVSAFSLTARIRDLRKAGWGSLRIVNRTRREYGRCHSFYMLVVP